MKAMPTLSRAKRRIALAITLLSVASFGACTMMQDHIRTYKELRAYAKENAGSKDLSETRMSENALFRATICPKVDPIPLNKLHAWTLHVEGADSSAIDGATIIVDGGMPEHGHGLPTKPQVTRSLGGGDYIVEGMKFQMPGWWVVQFEISTAEGSDMVTFNLML